MNRHETEEKRQHSSQLIPYSYYNCLIPDFFPCVPLHWHKEFEINFILDGSSDFICGDEKFTSHSGDIIIIPPNMLHAIYPHNQSRQRYDTLVFSMDMLLASAEDRCSAECIYPMMNGSSEIINLITPQHPYYSELRMIAETFFSCAKGNTPQLDMLMKSELLRFFWLLENNGDISRRENIRNIRIETIRPALEHINDHFSENITILSLAEKSHLSKSYFMNCFKSFVGIGAMEYVTQLRIKNACRLLEETDKTTAETAFECGFNNLSNFNRHFKEIVGCTPTEYRKLYRK